MEIYLMALKNTVKMVNFMFYMYIYIYIYKYIYIITKKVLIPFDSMITFGGVRM